MIDQGILKILFIKSEDNDADIYTKNLSEDLFIKHASKNVNDLYDQEEQGLLCFEYRIDYYD
jgi:hypothetical protein